MLSIRQYSKTNLDSLIECFNSIFDKTEIPYFELITDLSYSFVGLNRRNEVKAFIIVSKTAGKAAAFEIAYLGVSSRYRRRGYAKLLIEYVFRNLIGHTFWLTALVENTGARKLYEEIGFKEKERFMDRTGQNSIIYVSAECLD
jgi:ribosomal protein S18 acetylase RimI-like enzyme